MAYNLINKNGQVLAKILQFVATDDQVNAAITKYLHENGVSLAEGIDLKKLSENVSKNISEITGLKESVSDLKKPQTNVLLEYKDHFFSSWERGYINETTGVDTGDTAYVRSSGYQKITSGDTVLISGCPTGYTCAFYFYDANKKFVGASEMLDSNGYYKIQNSQVGWYVRAVVHAVSIDLDAINVILAGSAVSKLLEQAAADSGDTVLLVEDELDSAGKLELNVTKASIEAALDANCALIVFETDLHIGCPSGQTAEAIAKSATKIRRQLAAYNSIAKAYPIDLCVYGGDYLNNSSQTNRETATEALKAVRMLIDQTAGAPVLIAKGNHDDNTMYTDYKNGYISIDSLYKILTNKDSTTAVRNADHLEMSYGYYDIPNKKIRVFILNTLDLPTELDEDINKITYSAQNDAGFRQDQLQFVADHLQFYEKGWQVMFFCHHPMLPFTKDDAEPSNNSKPTGAVSGKGGCVLPAHGSQAMLDIITAFAAGTKGTSTNTTQDFEASVSYDFTQNKSNTVIACIYGHTHVVYRKVVDGINHIATRAVYGHPTFDFISTGNYFVVDRKNRVLKLIANGDGDDYEFAY
ncbi:MAG: metallophosphoesterase family protein [Lachnospiraceae bacterium]